MSTQFITVDYETYYAQDYSLRQMTPAEYILDPRFEVLGAAVKMNDDPSYWVDGPELPAHFATIDWTAAAHASHNAGFDAAISSWKYGIQPGLWIDTLAMARPTIYPHTGTISLASCAKYLGLPEKGGAIHKMKGYQFREFKANIQLYAEGVDYARHDADLCRAVFLALQSQFPADEFVIMDMVIRMIANPQFLYNPAVLHAHLADVLAKKDALLDRLGFTDASELMSNDKFALLLQEAGVDPPRKVSQVTGKEAWAFSKQDQAFLELQEHDDPDVQALMAARFGHKSTLEESRTKRFIAIANLPWPGEPHRAPIPLRYGGAHTHRLSGDWKLNKQNLQRINPAKPDPSALRYSLIAPEGHTVITADSAQIEARVNPWLTGQTDLVQAFADGVDVYSDFASDIFGVKVAKATHPVERFIGKTGILGLGFGVGHAKFGSTIPIQSRNQLGQEVRLAEGQAKQIVDIYRRKYHHIANGWQRAEQLIAAMFTGQLATLGVVFTRKNEVRLPNGMALVYPGLERCDQTRARPDGSTYVTQGWRYRYGKEWRNLYGAKLIENIVQALARIVTMSAAVAMRRLAPKYPLALQCHDELVFIVRDDDVSWFTVMLDGAMTAPPSWAAGLPLAVEIGKGRSYGDAK